MQERAQQNQQNLSHAAPEKQFRHFLPPIIPKELWEQTQCLLSARKRDRAGSNKTKGPQISNDLWGYTSVKNILRAEFYTGTQINHRRETSVCKGGSHAVPEEEQFRREDVYPILISKEMVQGAETA